MENKKESRRKFIKKAAYVVPTVIALGQLTNPTNANADKKGDNHGKGRGHNSSTSSADYKFDTRNV